MTVPTRPWPSTKRLDIVDTIFGKKIADPYRWLEEIKSARRGGVDGCTR